MVGIINFYRSTTWSYFIRSKTQFICDRGKGKGEMEWLASIPFETPVGVYFYWCILHNQLARDDSSYIFYVMIFLLPVLAVLSEEEQWEQIAPVMIHSLAAAWIILRWRHSFYWHGGQEWRAEGTNGWTSADLPSVALDLPSALLLPSGLGSPARWLAVLHSNVESWSETPVGALYWRQ